MSLIFKVKTYSDPGHGWAAVKRELLTQLGIADKITRYSYQKGKTVYLEEDCDLTTLMDALQSRGIKVEFEHKNTNRQSPIRSYERYRNF